MKRFAAAGLLPLALASSALAGFVTHSPDELRFVGTGEANRVMITDYGPDGYVVIDRAGRLRVGGDCFRDSARQAMCPAGDQLTEEVRVRLGGGRDRLVAEIRPGNRRESAKGISAKGGGGNDRLVARNRTSAIFRGDAGKDVLIGAPRIGTRLITWLSGGRGDDLLIVRSGEALALGGPGHDDLRIGGPGKDHDAAGGDGNDVIALSRGGGTVNGGEGDDRVSSGPYFTRLRGDAGDDAIDAATSTATAAVACGAGTDSVIMGPEDRFGLEGLMRESQDPADWGCENVTRR